jgi:hypothetical protein
MAFLRGGYHQILGPFLQFPKFANGLCRYCDTSVHLDSHFIWQATESYVERGSAFGLISHEGSLNSLQPQCAVSDGIEDIFGPAIFMKLGMCHLASIIHPAVLFCAVNDLTSELTFSSQVLTMK